MHPAFSVIFLTTLIGAAQGLFLALFTAQSYAAVGFVSIKTPHQFYAYGSAIVLVLLAGGLIASFFHLGHPERAWRSAARWRTSWLSREVIVLPTFMLVVFIYAVMHYFNWDPMIIATQKPLQGQLSLYVGIIGALVSFALFICTAMIYACIKFLQEWHNPLTVINYLLLGTASGFTLATAYSSIMEPELVNLFGTWATIITITAFVTRSASLIRNSRIKYKSTLQTAIGVRHSVIQQKSMGAMGGSFNTREYFHNAKAGFFKSMKWIFLILVFLVPVILLTFGVNQDNTEILIAAFIFQYIGLIAERWFFFAQANHPQNLYYQTV
ncbi:MAG: dimethyl sulfoxide reductase anchor subunit [Gammaproteobacteria bacterium]|nr:dimethyl sulfoxide reductase anchor subunit [Gammaproteobacteria bacterium]